MKRSMTVFVSSTAVLFAAAVFAQDPGIRATPKAADGSSMSGSQPVATPGMQRTPSAPEEGNGKSFTPGPMRMMTDQDRARATPTSGSDMPTGHPGGMRGPAAAADCSNNGWSSFTSPKFKNQKGCETWVRGHAAKTAPMAGTPHSGTANPGDSSGQPMARTPVAPMVTPPSNR